MQAHWFISLRKTISPRRLESYRQSANDTDLDLLAHYTWNVRLSEAFHPLLHGLEIALRNSIHETVADAFNNGRWLQTHLILKLPEQETVRQAKEKLRKQNKPLEEGRLIAELGFGFWTSLLDVRYEQVLWPWLLKQTFPAMPRRIRTRRTLSKRLDRARYLRNRVFHHEPIWYWSDLSNNTANCLRQSTGSIQLSEKPSRSLIASRRCTISDTLCAVRS